MRIIRKKTPLGKRVNCLLRRSRYAPGGRQGEGTRKEYSDRVSLVANGHIAERMSVMATRHSAATHFWLLTAAVLACVAFPCPSRAAGDVLSCSNQDYDERAMLRESAGMAARTGKHTFVVKYSGGTKLFVDKPPHAELSGTHWHYCGYNKQSKMSLIGKQTEGLFSGVILFQETGATIHAGHTVLISPDKKYILAVEQEDGMDGELWSLLDFSGKRLWRGYAGITKTMTSKGHTYDSIYAEYENPRRENGFAADFVCPDGPKKGVVTLKQAGKQWKWLPEYTCP